MTDTPNENVYQIHIERLNGDRLDPDDPTAGWILQFGIPAGASQSEANTILGEQMKLAKKNYPLPEGCRYMVHTERSKRFFWAADPVESP